MSGINIVGPGGIIEGTTNDVDVNVNLDSALLFDGTNDSVDCNDVSTLDGATDITLTCWIKPVALSGTDYFLSKEVDGSNKIGIAWDSDLLYFQVADDANAYGTCAFDDATYNGVWTHLALVFDGGATGNANRLKAYINGVEQTLSFTGTIPAQTDSNSADFLMAKFSSNYYNGYIADVKIYNTNLGETDIQTLASKINYPDTLSTGTRHWWKINEGTGTTIEDHGAATDFDGTVTGATWKYDQFYVDLQDNNTGGSGTFKVTQGKVEGLALTSVDFDGTASRIDLGTGLTVFDGATEGTVSAWIRRDAAGNVDTIISHYDSTDSNRQFNFQVNASNKVNFIVQNDKSSFNSDHDAEGATDIDTNQWYHIVGTFSTTNGQKVYVNGVHDGTATTTIEDALDTVTTDAHIGVLEQGGSYTGHADGLIRDVRLYDFELSAEQVASLCANTLPITPKHHYKLDEGSGGNGTTVADSGTGTAVDGTLAPAGNAPNWSNGTLTLDGTLTLGESDDSSVEATISAPRGILHLTADLQSFGAITHNNGTFKLDNGSSMHTYNVAGGSNQRELTFYNVTMEGTGGDGYRIGAPITIEKDWIINNTRTSVSNNAGGGHNTGVVVTLGTTTSAGSLTINSGKELETYTYSNSHSVTYQGVSPLYPALFTNNGTFEETLGSLLETVPEVKFSNLKFALPFATRADDGDSGGGSKITLIGDCEFDDLTLTLGDDELHTDGHRLQAVDFTVQSTSTLDWEDSLCVFSGHVDLNGNITTANSDTKIIHDTSAEKNWRSLYADAGVFFANGTQTTMTGYNWTSTGNEPTKVIAGSIFNTNSLKMNCTNLTIPSGGNFSGSTNIHSIAGDWTSSGGLIGKTGLYLDGLYEVQFDGSNAAQQWDSGASANGTVEGWFKADAFSYDVMARSYNNGKWMLIMNTGDLQFMATDNSNVTKTISATHGLSADTWFHAAGVCDGTSQLLYINGKLVASGTKNAGLKSATGDWALGKNPDDTTNNYRWDGHIHQFRVWKEARTVTEIRANMFTTSPTDSNTALAANINFETYGGGTSVVTDAAGNGNGVLRKWDGSATVDTTDTAAWAGGGTFTQGTSTVDLTGTGTLTYQGDIDFNILKCAAATKTTTIGRLSSGYININTNIYKGAGTLSRDGSLSWRMSWKSGTGAVNNSGLSVSGASYPVDLSDTYVVYYHDATIAKEVYWDYYINATNVTLAANQKARGYWMNATYQTDAGDYNLECDYMRFSDSANGKFIMGAGDLWFKSAANGLELTYPSNTFTAGPGATVSGSSAGTNFKSQNNFIVVGRVENLDVTNEELSVTGQVINCTGDIIQQHPTIDHDQQLDFDTADDRDVILGRDLDKNTELINS